jgi:hypothetical protein
MDCSVLVFSAFGLMEFIGEGCGLLRNGLLSSGRETSAFFWGGLRHSRLYLGERPKWDSAVLWGKREPNRIDVGGGAGASFLLWGEPGRHRVGGWFWFLDHRVVRGKKLRTNEQILNELLLNELQRRS